MSNTYNFLSVGGSAKQTIPFGFKSRVLGPKFLYTCKFRVNDTKAEFISKYLVGRLPEFIVSKDRVKNRRGHYATTFMLVTEDYNQREVLWQALKYAEAFDLRKQADFAEVKAKGWQAVDEYNMQQQQLEMEIQGYNSLDAVDDLPF